NATPTSAKSPGGTVRASPSPGRGEGECFLESHFTISQAAHADLAIPDLVAVMLQVNFILNPRHLSTDLPSKRSSHLPGFGFASAPVRERGVRERRTAQRTRVISMRMVSDVVSVEARDGQASGNAGQGSAFPGTPER